MENSRNYGKRKKADGSVEEYSSAKQKDRLTKDAVETAMVEFFDDIRESKKQAKAIDENAVEIDMMKWIGVHDKTIGSLLDEANVPGHLFDEAYRILSDLELSTVVNMFCSKGRAFTCDEFKKEMADLGVDRFVYHKVFKVLNQWKNAVISSKENQVNSELSISTVGNESNDSVVVLNML